MHTAEFEFHYPAGPHIHRGLAEAMLKEFLGRLDIKVRDVGTGWVWYRLPTIIDGALGIGFELGFNQGHLEQITIFHDDATIYGKDWNDWSEEKEQIRANTTGSWLRTKGYPIGKYSWGEVWSCYDARSGFGGGGVRYTL